MSVISNNEISRDEDQTEVEPHCPARTTRTQRIKTEQNALNMRDILQTSSTCALLMLESLTWIFLYTESGNDHSGPEDLRETIVLSSLSPMIFNCVLCLTEHTTTNRDQASGNLPFFIFILPAPILL